MFLRWLTGALVLGVIAAGVRWNTRVAGGSDSYGYVSQAELWLNGRLTIAQPWTGDPPFPAAEWSFSPLGYRPSVDRQAIVPKYAAGLPMLMAAAKAIGGQCAIFWVVPLFGGLLMFATYVLGLRLGSGTAGLMAAWLVATSPTFLYMLVQPMSDVPVAAVSTLALCGVLADTMAGALAGGALAALGILIRPNLVPLGGAVIGWLMLRIWASPPGDRGRRLRETVAFTVALSPGVIVTAILNNYWYGSPFRSGYEPLDVLFSWSNVLPNLRLYGKSLILTQTVFALVGIAAWFLPPRWVSLERRRTAQALGAGIVFMTWVEYCAYTVFGPWWYLRFLLPVWPLMMLGLALVVLRIVSGRGTAWRLAAGVFVFALGLYTLRWTVVQTDTFLFRRGEHKYVTAATVTRTMTERNAVVFSGQHSGSLRYYGGRLTIAYFNVYPAHFWQALDWITLHGGHPYALLEKWEVDEFRRRFGTRPPTGLLPMNPLVVYHGSETIYLFDLLQTPDSLRGIYDMPEQPVPDECAKPATPPRWVPK